METSDFGLERGTPQDIVAWLDDGPVTRARLLDDIARLARELEQHRGRRWLVATESSYACVVALFATWSARCIAVLPPNREVGTLTELANDVAGLLSDSAVVVPHLRVVSVFDERSVAPHAKLEVVLDEPGIELCTSGSTGARKVVVKRPRQLLSEVDALEASFGATLRGARILGSVSHQHIYGLLFRVLWPLRVGRAFVDQSAVDPAHLTRQLAACDSAVLIASPAHLERLHEFIELATLAPKCVAIFSSGGPLARSAALRFEAALGVAPTEVLGSTETGGIAWRRRRATDTTEQWTIFPGTTIDTRDGVMSVSSPNTGGERWTTGDAIERTDDTHFVLQGRADRIVKLFEERVALPEVESRLQSHPWVARAAAVVIERAGQQRLGVVLEFTREGTAEFARVGKVEMSRLLRESLAPYFRATVLPRAWRFVERMPEDAQGKRNVGVLRALFDEPERTLDLPLVGTPERRASGMTCTLAIPEKPWYVEGHFETRPIVPGVVQIQWAVLGACLWFGRDVVPREVMALKYKDMLRPGSRVFLELEVDETRLLAKFRVFDAAREYSSGRIAFA